MDDQLDDDDFVGAGEELDPRAMDGSATGRDSFRSPEPTEGSIASSDAATPQLLPNPESSKWSSTTSLPLLPPPLLPMPTSFFSSTGSLPQLPPAQTPTVESLPPAMATTVEDAPADVGADVEYAGTDRSPPAPADCVADGPLAPDDFLGEAERVRLLARGYRTSGAPVGEICAHNASVAEAVGDLQLASAWEALDAILRQLPDATAEGGHRDGLAAEAGVATEGGEGLAAAAAQTDAGGRAEAEGAGGAGLGIGLGDPSLFAAGWGLGADASRDALLEGIAPVIGALLDHHAERGDAQTCAVLARTLHPIVPDLVPAKRMQLWTLAYVAQLQRLQLFALANEVIKQSDDQQVNQLNQRSTTVTVGGGGASASQGKPPRARCSVCQLPVRGVYVWCQGCGHGGHVNHMRAWFSQSTECPTGCGHQCLLRPCALTAAGLAVDAAAQPCARPPRTGG